MSIAASLRTAPWAFRIAVPSEMVWSLSVVGGAEIRQTPLLEAVNPSLWRVLEIRSAIPEILADRVMLAASRTRPSSVPGVEGVGYTRHRPSEHRDDLNRDFSESVDVREPHPDKLRE